MTMSLKGTSSRVAFAIGGKKVENLGGLQTPLGTALTASVSRELVCYCIQEKS